MRSNHAQKVLANLTIISLIAVTWVGVNVVQAQSEESIWNGEVSVANLVFDYGTLVNHDAYQGNYTFEGVPDQWHQPAISLAGLAAWRKDISGFDEIRFYAKANEPGKIINFSVYGWPYTSKVVAVNLATSYQLVKVPLALLKTADYSLSSIEIFYFGAASPGVGHKIYIDNISVYKASGGGGEIGPLSPPPSETPPSGGTSSGQININIGSVTSSAIDLSWANPGGVTGINIYLSPEPFSTDGTGPIKKLITNLGSLATTHKLTGLSALTDWFIRVEALTGSGVVSGNAHSRTRGGPRANLDTPLRSIHGYGPNIILLVLEDKNTNFNGSTLTGNDGTSWQTGQWTVTRANGQNLTVNNVYRRSIPVAQPDYEIGSGARNNINSVDVDHEIYLVLSEAIGNVDILRITGPMGLNFSLAWSDKYLETPVIQLNQAGYSPRSKARFAYVSGYLGNGGPLSLSNFPNLTGVLSEPSNPLEARSDVLTNLALTIRSASDSDSGGPVGQIDLSRLPASNTNIYRVRLSGVGVSYPAKVSEQAVFNNFYAVGRGLFHNRWGGDLQADLTDWSRPKDHLTVYSSEIKNFTDFVPSETPKIPLEPVLGPAGESSANFSGGYHDAGDFDQRPMHVLVAQLLLRAYELNKEAFTDSQLNIPEKGNSIPDLLDEALWGVKGWENLQQADGSVRLGVESSQHPNGIYFANQDPLNYWTYGSEPNHTARTAGLFAQAARLIQPYDLSRSNGLKNRAINAFNYARTHGSKSGSLLYASGELLRLTGENQYKTAFESNWRAMGPYGAFSNFAVNQFYLGDFTENNRAMPDYILGYLMSGQADPVIKSLSIEWLDRYAQEAKNNILSSSHGHRSARPAGQQPDWGNGVTLGKFMDTIYARLQLGGLSEQMRQEYFDALSLAADYTLGANPDGRVYFTGLGTKNVQEPLHLDSLAFIKQNKGPIPGIPVFGPTAGLPYEYYYKPGETAFYPAFSEQPLMRRYADIRTFVVTNEFSVWESQAPSAQLLATLVGLNLAPSSDGGTAPPASETPPGETPPTLDTSLPVVSLFMLQPFNDNKQVIASFIVADSGGSFLKRVELNRANFNASNCNDTLKSGCLWSLVATLPLSGDINSRSGTLTNTPEPGTYFYGLHAIDSAGNRGVEPAPIKITIPNITLPPETPPQTTPPDLTPGVSPPPPPGGGGWGGGNGGATPQPPATPENIKPEAEIISHGSREAVAEQVRQQRSEAKEAEVSRTVVSRILPEEKVVAQDSRSQVLNFVSYGTPLTQRLGAGERAGVVNSFQESFGRLPESEADWAHIIKIAAGRWPEITSLGREITVEPNFRKIYLRSPNRANPHDDAAMVIMAYGVRPKPRNLDNEKTAIKILNAIFRRLPTTATAWDMVRAIAYSGAKR